VGELGCARPGGLVRLIGTGGTAPAVSDCRVPGHGTIRDMLDADAQAPDVPGCPGPRGRERASEGPAADGPPLSHAVAAWRQRRLYRVQDFTAELLQESKGDLTVTVIVPTKDCAATIAGVLGETVAPLMNRGLVDELVVVDAASADATAEAAAAAGARVLQQDEIRPELGPALGKGDAMWRALQLTGGDIVCFVDADTVDPRPEHLAGLLGPMLRQPRVQLVKGAFERPLRDGQTSLPHEGGRVTELMARPLINLHAPLLAGFSQPLAGEFAARRELLESIPFPVGYGVEIAILIDALRAVGLDELAECHLGTRQNRHQPLRTLGEMAYAVLSAVENRIGNHSLPPDGRYVKPWADGAVSAVPVLERPPIRQRAVAPAPALSRRLRG
jgi:glucosyl-3-phosphoglycerate synthase